VFVASTLQTPVPPLDLVEMLESIESVVLTTSREIWLTHFWHKSKTAQLLLDAQRVGKPMFLPVIQMTPLPKPAPTVRPTDHSIPQQATASVEVQLECHAVQCPVSIVLLKDETAGLNVLVDHVELTHNLKRPVLAVPTVPARIAAAALQVARMTPKVASSRKTISARIVLYSLAAVELVNSMTVSLNRAKSVQASIALASLVIAGALAHTTRTLASANAMQHKTQQWALTALVKYAAMAK